MVEPFRRTVYALRANAFKELRESLPKTTKECLTQPLLMHLIQPAIAGRQRVQAFLHAEIIRMTAQMNVAHPMSTAQILFAVDMILEEFPTESLADVTLVLDRIAKGYYGSTYHQLDASTIRICLAQHFQEKTYFREADELKAKKDNQAQEVDYTAFMERRKKELAQEDKKRQARIQEIVDQDRIAEIKAGYKPPTAERVLLLDAIREAGQARFGNNAKEIQASRIFHVEGIPVFAPSLEWAQQILQEARVILELAKTNKP